MGLFLSAFSPEKYDGALAEAAAAGAAAFKVSAAAGAAALSAAKLGHAARMPVNAVSAQSERLVQMAISPTSTNGYGG